MRPKAPFILLVLGSLLTLPLVRGEEMPFDQCLWWALASNDLQLRNNVFGVWRGGLAYLGRLGGRILYDLDALPEDAHWLDAGAGHAEAMKDLVAGVRDILGRTVKVKARRLTALGLAKPGGFSEGILASRDFRYLEGKYLEDYRFEEIGVCDLITDLWGPFSYTAQIDVVLRKYLELLKVGGKLYIEIKPGSTAIDGLSLRDYLARIPGIRAEVDSYTVRIEKTGWTRGEDVPRLKLEEFRPSSPPIRRWRIMDGP
jgi:hypothetical protein